MNKFTCSILASALSLSAYSVSAATNTDDASALGTSDTPQIVQQNKTTNTSTSNKIMSKKDRMHKNNADMKMMDTNNDGKVSKDEYMSYHEQAYSNMKQTDGMVNLKDMNAGVNSGSNKNSMNNKPIGTTSGVSKSGSVDITKEGEPINGTQTGTNK
ncbi:MAG: EF-hand domain-containing protein [Methylotenera sp.]